MAKNRETIKTVADFIFLGSKIAADGDCSHEIKRHLLLGRKAMTNLDSILKSRDINLLTNVCLFKVIVFTIVMYEYESWTIKKGEPWRIDVLNYNAGGNPWESLRLQDQTSQSQRLSNQSIPKEIKPVNPKRNQTWIFIGRTGAKSEAPIFWPPGAKNWVIGKHPDAGKNWRQEEKETTEGEMVVWHPWINEHEFEQAPGDGEGQGSLVWGSPWDLKESKMTEWLKWHLFLMSRQK